MIGRQAPLMVADDHVTQCQLCDKKFTMFFRRHHCRACGKVVCNYCCNNTVPLEYKDYRDGIACDVCYQILLSGLTDRINNKDTPHFPILVENPDMESTLLGKFRKRRTVPSKHNKNKKRRSFLNEVK